MNDRRWSDLFFVILLILGLLLGRALLKKKAQVLSSPTGYTEQVEGLDGTPAR